MSVADDIILKHGAQPYDPQKRHEYYVRTRQLKGYLPRGTVPATTPSAARPTVPSAQTKRPKQPPKNQSSTSWEHKSSSEKVDDLSKRLNHLQDVLQELVRQAKVRSGVEVKPASESSSDSPSKKTETSSTKKDSPDKPKTAEQKRKDAERAKEYRDKQNRNHPSKAPQDSTAKMLEARIKDTQVKIRKMRETLASARRSAGESKSQVAGSVGASSTRI